MRPAFCLLIAAVLLALPASAQAQPVAQIELSEKQVQAFLAAHPEVARIEEKLQPAELEKPDAKLMAALDALAKKHGFAGIDEYDAVAANISLILQGLDPETKEFTEPAVMLRREIDELAKDASIPAKEKKQMLDELNAALKETQPIRHRGNIELVKKYFDRLELLMQ